jgi:two-component system phosphate regulon sensor histidine kinase PhoR
LSKKEPNSVAAARIRRRDTVAVAGLGGVVLAVLAFNGVLTLVEALVASFSMFVLSAIYHLTASTTLSPARTEEAQAAPPTPGEPAPDPDVVNHSMLERLPIPVLLIGPGGRIEKANPAARDFLGLGSARGHLSAALRQPRVLEAVSAALRGETAEPVEYSMLAPIESHVRAFVSPLRVEEAGAFPWRAMLVLADETSIKRAERMRADFLANASHELRTPLASLAGFIETLTGHAKDDAGAREKFLAIMQDQTERMRRLIDDLLSLSRVEMDEHLPPDGVVDMASLAHDTLGALRPQLDAKSIEADVAADGPARAVGDRDQLTEVLQNLVENAIKYSAPGSAILLDVKGEQRRDQVEVGPLSLGEDASRLALASPPTNLPGAFVAVSVRDQGQGIDRRDLPRLSERFFRVDGQKSGPREGTGLGLAIVKHIINRHRGGFVVESALGEGSVFTVSLPCAPEQTVQADPHGADTGADAVSEPTGAEPGAR